MGDVVSIILKGMQDDDTLLFMLLLRQLSALLFPAPVLQAAQKSDE